MTKELLKIKISVFCNTYFVVDYDVQPLNEPFRCSVVTTNSNNNVRFCNTWVINDQLKWKYRLIL